MSDSEAVIVLYGNALSELIIEQSAMSVFETKLCSYLELDGNWSVGADETGRNLLLFNGYGNSFNLEEIMEDIENDDVAEIEDYRIDGEF